MRTRCGRVGAAVAAVALTWGATSVAGATEPGTVVAGNSSAAPNHCSGGIIGGDHDSSSFSFTADPLPDQRLEPHRAVHRLTRRRGHPCSGSRSDQMAGGASAAVELAVPTTVTAAASSRESSSTFQERSYRATATR